MTTSKQGNFAPAPAAGFLHRTMPAFLRRALAFGLLTLLAAPAFAQPAAPATADVLRDITEAVGLKPRFELRATREVSNAAAVVYDGKRFLLYNPDFVASVNRAGHTDWAGTSILAHEMGHHLNGHTLRGGGSNPADELEADEFSGFVLRKMGASLAQAQSAMATVADDGGSATHPGRTVRLAAIGQGWQRADAQITASAQAPAPSAAPALVAAAPAPRNDTNGALAALRSGAAPAEHLVGSLTFRDRPDVRYYLTSALKVVYIDDNDLAEEVGHLTRTRSATFPYVLTDGRRRKLFITPGGDVYDQGGDRVAKMKVR